MPEYDVPPLLRNDEESKRRWQAAVAEAQSRLVNIQAKDAHPLEFITFFELARVGLSAKAADGTVTVANVTAGSACQKAGLKAGDVVLDVGGKKPTDAESLRRLLRDALALGDATVKLRRGTDTLAVKVALPE